MPYQKENKSKGPFTLKKLELILVSMAILSFALNLFQVPYSGLFAIIVFSLLSYLYFLCVLPLVLNKNLNQLFRKAAWEADGGLNSKNTRYLGVAWTCTIIGVLFLLLEWPFGRVVLVGGLGYAFISSLFMAYAYYKNRSGAYKEVLIRTVASFGICLFFYLNSPFLILEFKYRDHPTYIEAVKNLESVPTNEEFKEKLEEERLKLKAAD